MLVAEVVVLWWDRVYVHDARVCAAARTSARSQPHHLQLELPRALVLGFLLSHIHGAQIRHVRQNDEVDHDQDHAQDLVVVLEIRREHNERTDKRKHDLVLSGKRQHVGLESLVGEPLPVEHAVED